MIVDPNEAIRLAVQLAAAWMQSAEPFGAEDKDKDPIAEDASTVMRFVRLTTGGLMALHRDVVALQQKKG